jgi:flagellar protein FlaJ
MELNKSMWSGIIFGLIIILGSIAFFYSNQLDLKVVYFLCGIAVIVISMPFFINSIVISNQEKNKEQMFLEFTRDLVEGVKSGTPISRSIINVKTKDYGNLSPHVSKLANQISMGIPVRDALDVFSREVDSVVIARAVSLIREAERSGGRIESILESVSFSVSQIEKLKKERKAAIYNLTVQGYIIFFIFIVIMLVMQFKILPITSQLGTGGNDIKGIDLAGLGGNIGAKIDIDTISNSFLYLLLAQGFFAGLVIGKISEGTVKAGLKHSFVLVSLSLLISTGARAFLG